MEAKCKNLVQRLPVGSEFVKDHNRTNRPKWWGCVVVVGIMRVFRFVGGISISDERIMAKGYFDFGSVPAVENDCKGT